MKYWQFVNWEPTPIESALKSRVAVAIAALWSYMRRISPLFMPYWGGIMF